MKTGDGDSPRPIKYKNNFVEGPQYGEYFKGKTGNAPYKVAPGTRRLEGVHVTNSGVEQPWIAYYDEYGRLIARTDYNAPSPAAGIPSTHYHKYNWTQGSAYEDPNHYPGEYKDE